MSLKVTSILIRYFSCIVWGINGIYCKILNFVPRHQQIVSRILGDEYGRELTVLIGVSEIAMIIWILSQFKPKMNAIFQIVVVIAMNLIEYRCAADLLLWGKVNIIFAFLFAMLVYYNQFFINKQKLI